MRPPPSKGHCTNLAASHPKPPNRKVSKMCGQISRHPVGPGQSICKMTLTVVRVAFQTPTKRRKGKRQSQKRSQPSVEGRKVNGSHRAEAASHLRRKAVRLLKAEKMTTRRTWWLRVSWKTQCGVELETEDSVEPLPTAPSLASRRLSRSSPQTAGLLPWGWGAALAWGLPHGESGRPVLPRVGSSWW